jgi:hypothetical protein
MKALIYTLLATSLALFGLAAYAYVHWDDAPGAFVEEPDREFPSLVIGVNEASFRLHNPTKHKIRVVGYQFC